MQQGGSSVAGPRPYNEDSFLTRDLRDTGGSLSGLLAFTAVSDGMGGHQSGDVASRVAMASAEHYVDYLVSISANADVAVDFSQALREIVTEAHQAVLDAAAERGAASMGATFVGAFLTRDRAWIGHVGDSRAYLVRAGAAQQLTIDHSQVGRLIADGTLTEEQAQHHPNRNVIERALGFSGAEADVSAIELEPGDVLVLCSDGVSTVLQGEMIAEIVGASRSAEDAATALTNAALAAGTDDNATVTVWSADGAPFRGIAAGGRRRGRHSAVKRPGHRDAQLKSLGAIAGVLVLGGLLYAGAGGSPEFSQAVRQVAVASGVATATAEPEYPEPKPDKYAGRPFPKTLLAATKKGIEGKPKEIWLRTGPGKQYEVIGRLKVGGAVVRAHPSKDGSFWVVSVKSIAKDERSGGFDPRELRVVYVYRSSLKEYPPRDVKGLTEKKAKEKLGDDGYRLGRTKRVFSNASGSGRVVSVERDGNKVALIVSKGPWPQQTTPSRPSTRARSREKDSSTKTEEEEGL